MVEIFVGKKKILYSIIFIIISLISCKNVTESNDVIFTLESPIADKKVNRTLELYGKWKSEAQIRKIEVVLIKENSEIGSLKYNFLGVVEYKSLGEGTWSCTLDVQKSKVPAGNYNILISCYVLDEIIKIDGNKITVLDPNSLHAPTISIISPKNYEILRNKFIVEGDCTDSIPTDVIVSLRYIESCNDDLKYEYKAKIIPGNEKYIWKCEINTKGENKIKDGEYVISIVVFDAYGHQTNAIRSVIIDNTSSVLMVEKIKDEGI